MHLLSAAHCRSVDLQLQPRHATYTAHHHRIPLWDLGRRLPYLFGRLLIARYHRHVRYFAAERFKDFALFHKVYVSPITSTYCWPSTHCMHLEVVLQDPPPFINRAYLFRDFYSWKPIRGRFLLLKGGNTSHYFASTPSPECLSNGKASEYVSREK